MIESYEEKSCRLFDQAIYIYLISCWVKFLNSTWVLEFNFSIQLDTFSKKFQLNLILFELNIQLELEYSTWRDQFNSTSTWHKLNQEKKRVIQYNHTLFSHRAHLSFITHFSAQWMTIIEQENIVFNITITSIMSAKKLSLTFVIEDWKSKHLLYKISSMKSRTKTMHHN